MPKDYNMKEFVNMTKQGLGKFLNDFMENLEKEIVSITTDGDNTASDVRETYENYKIKAASNVNTDSDKSLEQREKTNYDIQDSSVRKKEAHDDERFLNINFAEENLMQAMIYTEILGKPRAKRRRR